MPIYSYYCKGCNVVFDKLFATMSIAEPHLDKHKCKCGKSATRKYDKPPKFFMKFGDKPMYSDNSDPDK
jgi:putative FmdB family regulatory protein